MNRLRHLLMAAALVATGCTTSEPDKDEDGPSEEKGDDGSSDGDESEGSEESDDGLPPATKDAGKPGSDASRPSPKPDAGTASGDDAGSKPASDGGGTKPSSDAATKPTPDAGAGSDAGPAPVPERDGGAPKPSTCSSSLKAGDTRVSIEVGGQKRAYILHVPTSYKGDQPVPLLLDLHPMLFGTGQSQRNSSGYAAVADREGFLVAYPDGVGGALSTAWNLGPCCTQSRTVDDFGFMLEIVKKTKAEGCVDDKRIYAAGYSNGGGLSHYLACKHADVFAAVSPAAFDLIEEVECKPSRPISVISFRGTSDAIVPYKGGASTPPTPWRLAPIHFLGAEKTFQKWAELNGCTGTPAAAGKAGCVTYPKCKDDVEVTLCTAQGGGHVTGEAEFGWSRLKTHTLP